MVVPNVMGAACVLLLGSRVHTRVLVEWTATGFACLALALRAFEIRKAAA
jgi:hypothetical protein